MPQVLWSTFNRYLRYWAADHHINWRGEPLETRLSAWLFNSFRLNTPAILVQNEILNLSLFIFHESEVRVY